MYVVTLGVGWVIWSLVVWGQGQTPGKQIVKLRVYDQTTSKPVKWAYMALRQFALPASFYLIFVILSFALNYSIPSDYSEIVSIFLGVLIFGVLLTDIFLIFRDGAPRRLVDLICKTDVLNEAN